MPESHSGHYRWYGNRVGATLQDALPVLAGRILSDIEEARTHGLFPVEAGIHIGISGRVLTITVLVPRRLVGHDRGLPQRIDAHIRGLAAPYNWYHTANMYERRFYLEVDLAVSTSEVDPHCRSGLWS